MELAFNMNGEPFDVPAIATGWRVRKMKQKGAPEVVYGRDGLPLVVPIDAALDDLRDEVAGATGRFRLDPVDETNRPIANAPAAYVFVHPATARGPEVATTSSMPPLPPPSDNIAVESMRLNADIARSIIERFPQMMESAATLLRAADGAGLPARAPRIVDEAATEDESTEAAPAPPTGFDVNALVAQVVTVLVTSIANGNLKVPGLGSLLDWRKAKPIAAESHPTPTVDLPSPPTPTRASKPTATTTSATPSASSSDAGLPPLDPVTLAHFAAVQAALSPEERAVAREVASELSLEALRGWFDELSKLSVPDAAARIRTMIRRDNAGVAS